MYPIYDYSGVDGSEGVFVEPTMNHSVGSRPGRSKLMASTARPMVIEQNQGAQLKGRKVRTGRVAGLSFSGGYS